ncbi:HTH_Tnp_Tc3_2 domain-containing protein [Trichonephila clavipes]|nr:HTH_Tnp_Tc3_2 domain-containing protein [Trichonephila clavipes]
MRRSDAAIRRCHEEWVNNVRFQRHDDSGRSRATADREDRFIVRSAITAPDSSIKTIRRAPRTRGSAMTIHRGLIERNLRSYRPLRYLPLTPAQCRARLQCCLAPFSTLALFFSKILPDHIRHARVAMNCLTACQILTWPARSPDFSSIGHVWDMMGRRLNLPGNVDDLARHLEPIWQEIPQETLRLLYHFMPCRVAA